MTDQPMTPGPEGPPADRGGAARRLRGRARSSCAIEDVLIQTVVSLLNLGARKAGLVPGSEDERDLEQVRKAIEGARALLPRDRARRWARTPRRCATRCPSCSWPTRSSRAAGEPGPGGPAGAPGEGSGAPGGEGAGPAQSSGRLWVPGQ